MMKRVLTILIIMAISLSTLTLVGCGERSITLDANGGTVSTQTITVKKGKDFVLPTPTREGYTFSYWENDGERFYPLNWDYKKDLNLKAVWSANSYKVKFLNSTIGEQEYVYGKQYTLPEPQKVGYSFLGWTYDTVLIPQTGDWNISKDIELTPNWKQISYKVYYDLDGGEWGKTETNEDVLPPSSTASYGVNYEFLCPVKTNMKFRGWKNVADADETNLVSPGVTLWTYTTDMYFKAIWGEIISYVVYDLNGGTINGEAATTIAVGKDYTFPAISKPNYTFTGWTIFGDETETVYQAGDKITNWQHTSDVKLIANFIPNKVSVKYYYDDTKTTLLYEDVLDYNTTHAGYNGTLPTKDGYYFVWSVDYKNKTITESVEVFAIWKSVNDITVTFNPLTGTLNGNSTTVFTLGKSYDLSQFTVTPPTDDFRFIGWYVMGDDSQKVLEKTGVWTTEGENLKVTLYAKFEHKNDDVGPLV